MTSVTTEQLPPPTGGAGTSAFARERAVRVLAFEVAVALPSPGWVVVKEVIAPDEPHTGLGWRTLLADVVGSDREEHVGGTLHARPVVAVR